MQVCIYYIAEINNKIIIENVEKDATRKLLVWFENVQKTGGDRIIEIQFLPSKKMLVITYENEIVAERVVKFGEVEIGNKKYKAKCFSRISTNDLTFYDIKEILASKMKNLMKMKS